MHLMSSTIVGQQHIIFRDDIAVELDLDDSLGIADVNVVDRFTILIGGFIA